MSQLTALTIEQAKTGLRNKEFSALELTEAYISAMEASRHLNAYITETPDIARRQAKEADARIAKGEAKGLLEGIPMAIKDLFCTNGVKTTAASRILDNFVPPYESTVTENLFRHGAVMLGKTNLDQFAMGSANITSYHGNVINPWRAKGSNKDLVPGGSSGGSSAATAAHLCAASLGTDTGGSIRQPAAFTGTVGVKPTYGRCSRWGTIAFASSLDQAGPIARTVKDAATVLQAIAGFDPKDSTSVDRKVPDWSADLAPDVKGKRIGIPLEYQVDGMPEEITRLWHEAAGWLKHAGAEIVDISLLHTKYALPAYYIVAPAEASANLARYDGVRFGHRTSEPVTSLDDMYERTRAEGFGDEVKRRIMIGTYVLSSGYYDAYYRRAQKVRTLIARDFEKAFEEVDAILTPTTPSSAFAIGENEDDPVKMYLNDLFTVPTSLAGLPGMSVPTGLGSKGLPLGVQIIGKAFDEHTMLCVGAAIEEAANFTAKPAMVEKRKAA